MDKEMLSKFREKETFREGETSMGDLGGIQGNFSAS